MPRLSAAQYLCAQGTCGISTGARPYPEAKQRFCSAPDAHFLHGVAKNRPFSVLQLT